MSLNQLTLDKEKPWLDIRVNSLKTDNALGEEFLGTISWAGAVGLSVRNYTAYKNGNQVIINFGILEAAAVSSGNIKGTPDAAFIANLLPFGPTKKAEFPCFVLENGQLILGKILIDNSGLFPEILVNVAYNKIAAGLNDTSAATLYADLQIANNNTIDYRPFQNVGTIGWPVEINMIYFLDQ